MLLSAPLEPLPPFPLCAARCALLAEVNHRTANQFTILTSYIHLWLEEFRRNPGEIKDLQLAFAAVEARARALANLNKQLMQRASIQEVDVSIILHEICSAFGSGGAGIHRVLDEIAGPFFVSSRVNVAAGQIITEAVMNALKYAYPAGQSGEVSVRSTSTDRGGLLVEVADRGIGGLPASMSPAATSFGVRLMRGLASQENISLSFVPTSPGLSVQLVLPAAGLSGTGPAEPEEIDAR